MYQWTVVICDFKYSLHDIQNLISVFLKETWQTRIKEDNNSIYAFGSLPFSAFADDQSCVVLYVITIFTDEDELLNTDQSLFNIPTDCEKN